MIKNWKMFTESYDDIAEYILVISTKYIGSDQYIDLFDFDDNDYDQYKKDKMSYQEEEMYMQQAIEEIGLSWEIDEENDELIVTTNSIGVEEYVQLDGNPYDIDDEGFDDFTYEDEYSEDDLENMAIDAIGVDWSIIPNEDHPNYQKKMSRKKFNL